MPDIVDTPDSENMFMDDRLNLQALKNKRYLDQTLEFDFFRKIDKKELLAMLLKSTTLLHLGAEKIAEQRTTINNYTIREINRLD
jgi:hypothetical protein